MTGSLKKRDEWAKAVAKLPTQPAAVHPYTLSVFATTDPRGNIVLDSQADSELIFIKNVTSNHPLVGRLGLTGYSGEDELGFRRERERHFGPKAKGFRERQRR